MLIGHQFYFFSKKFLNFQDDLDFIKVKNQFILQEYPYYQQLSKPTRLEVLLALMKGHFPTIPVENLLPSPPKTGLQKISPSQKMLEESRKSDKYFLDLLENLEKIIFMLLTKHPIYCLSKRKKQQLLQDLSEIIAENPEGIQVRINLYCLVHEYRGANNWLGRELEKMRLKCIQEIKNKHFSGRKWDTHCFLSFMKLANLEGLWESHALIQEDNLTEFHLQGLKITFKNFNQSIYASYLNQSIDALTQYCLNEIGDCLDELSIIEPLNTSCTPFSVFKPKVKPKKVLLWQEQDLHLGPSEYQALAETFNRLFTKGLLKKLECSPNVLKPLSELKNLIRTEITERLLKEGFFISFNEVLIDSKKEEELFFVGPRRFTDYKDFFYHLNTHHVVDMKLDERDSLFTQFCQGTLINARHPHIHVRYSKSKILLEKLIFEALDKSMRANEIDRIRHLTQQLIQFKKYVWHEMYELKEEYYQNPILMSELLKADPFLMLKLKDVQAEHIEFAKAIYPELDSLFRNEKISQSNLTELRLSYFLNILYSEEYITQDLISKHIFLLNTDEYINVLRVRNINGLAPMPGFHRHISLGLFENFLKERQKHQDMPDRLVRIPLLDEIFESNRGWYYQFQDWYAYHTSMNTCLKLLLASYSLSIVNFIVQLALALISIMLCLLTLILYSGALLAEKYLPIKKAGSGFFKNLMSEVSNKQTQFSKPLQILTDQVNEEWAEFSNAWKNVKLSSIS
jgi:hypothetical protein